MQKLPHTRYNIAKAGWAFIMTAVCVCLLCLLFGLKCLATLSFLFALSCIGFFRDPERDIPQGEGLILAPADGKVTSIEEVTLETAPGVRERFRRVAIFLSVFNVHVQRAPFAGTVESVKYFQGKFINALHEKSSDLNEHNMIWTRTSIGPVGVKQIAGLIARRIVCYTRPGDTVRAGERIGLIRFGSRTDAFFPLEAEVVVRVGDPVNGGLTILAQMPKKEV